MSLRKIVGKKKPQGSSGEEKPEPDEPKPPVMGSEAVIPQSRMEGLQQTVDAIRKASEGGGGLNMTRILSMDSQGTSMPDVLQIPIGGRENDAYKMVERTRLTQYQKGLIVKLMWRAENGLGYGPLKRPIPQLGSFVVFHLRAAVSVDGESLAVFERTVSAWEKMLYTQEAQIRQQQAKGITS